MYCTNCGHELYDGNKYCTNCGMHIAPKVKESDKKFNKILNIIIVSLFVLLDFVFVIYLLVPSSRYYFSSIIGGSEEKITKAGKTSVDASKYFDSYVGSEKEYKNEISKISEEEKEKCSKISTLKYEESLIKKYGLYSANLCELSDEYLENLLLVFDYAYNEYPGIFDYAYTNQILYDANSKFSVSNGYSYSIALYGIFDSIIDKNGTNNRLGMLLNTTYFLDETYFEQTIIKSVASNHFPANANKYSPIIHELGHKLHYDLVFMKYGIDNFAIINDSNYEKAVKVYEDLNNEITTTEIIKKAIKNLYNVDANDIKEYTKEISGYATVNSNEAIAEAVHDYYLNKENANVLSIEIVKVLKEERAKYFR